jgi:hypothetical protein
MAEANPDRGRAPWQRFGLAASMPFLRRRCPFGVIPDLAQGGNSVPDRTGQSEPTCSNIEAVTAAYDTFAPRPSRGPRRSRPQQRDHHQYGVWQVVHGRRLQPVDWPRDHCSGAATRLSAAWPSPSGRPAPCRGRLHCVRDHVCARSQDACRSRAVHARCRPSAARDGCNGEA